MRRITIILSVVLFLTGCKKYPEDDAPFHLRKPFDRLTSKRWKVESYTRIYPNTYPPACGMDTGGGTIVLRRNGTSGGGCNAANGISATGNSIPVFSHLYDWEGIWTLGKDDENIQVLNNDGYVTIWKILQLDRLHMKIASDSIEFVLKRTNEDP